MIFTPPPGLTRWPPVEQWTEVEWTCWLGQHQYTPEQIAQYLDHDRFAYGVGFTLMKDRATPKNAYNSGVTWLYKPTPKGVTLHQTRTSTVMNILWGGAAGGTKSMSARWEAIASCLFTDRDDYRVIILRRELVELERTHIDKLKTEAKKINALLGKDTVDVTAKTASFNTTDAKIIWGHAKDLGDEEKYNEDYDLLLGDEGTQLLWPQLVHVQGRVRNDPKRNRIGRTIITTNPGGCSAMELERYFILKNITKAENEKYDPADYQFISAKLWDNPFYMDPDGSYASYEKRLWMYSVARRQQLLDGDWSVHVGQFFETFDPELHVQCLA